MSDIVSTHMVYACGTYIYVFSSPSDTLKEKLTDRHVIVMLDGRAAAFSYVKKKTKSKNFPSTFYYSLVGLSLILLMSEKSHWLFKCVHLNGQVTHTTNNIKSIVGLCILCGISDS